MAAGLSVYVGTASAEVPGGTSGTSTGGQVLRVSTNNVFTLITVLNIAGPGQRSCLTFTMSGTRGLTRRRYRNLGRNVGFKVLSVPGQSVYQILIQNSSLINHSLFQALMSKDARTQQGCVVFDLCAAGFVNQDMADLNVLNHFVPLSVGSWF